MDTDGDEEARLGLLTLDRVADLLAVQTRLVREYVRDGRLPVVTLGPKTRRVRRSDLAAFIDSHYIGSAA